MTNINRLLNKYYTSEGGNLTAHDKINKAEKTSREYNIKQKREQYRRNRHLILDQLLTEIPFTLTNNQVQQIRFWIDRFNDNFKDFHKNSSNETIILAFIMIQWREKYPKTNISDYSITTKYDLNNQKFTLIQNRLIFQLMRTTELTYTQSKYVNNPHI